MSPTKKSEVFCRPGFLNQFSVMLDKKRGSDSMTGAEEKTVWVYSSSVGGSVITLS